MSKIEQKEIKLEIGLPQGPFPRQLYFNRFKVEREGEVSLVQFGLYVATELVDSYACVLPSETLRQNKKTLLEYLSRTGRPQTDVGAKWKGVSGGHRTDVADFISMAYRGESAEICLYCFSLSAATRNKRAGADKAGQTSEPLIAQPLVLLRCAPELQKQLIETLYEE